MKLSKPMQAAAILLIIVVLAFAYVEFQDKNQNFTDKGKEKTKSGNQNLEPSFAPKFGAEEDKISLSLGPNCPQNIEGIFTKSLIEASVLSDITPLGNSQGSSHVLPTDHVYLNFLQNDEGSVKHNLYAPSDLLLESMEAHISTDPAKKNEGDYFPEFIVCKGLFFKIMHMVTISKEIEEALAKVQPRCDDTVVSGGVGYFYKICQYDNIGLQLQAGDLIGTVGKKLSAGRRTDGFDYGVYNYNTAPLGYINQSWYAGDTLHTLCPLDLFAPELKAGYYAKLGFFDTQTNQLEPRTIEPRCGLIMQDIPGTVQGDWFYGQPTRDFSLPPQHNVISLLHYNLDPTFGSISVGGIIADAQTLLFPPTHEGLINREFSEVKADGKLYCYERGEKGNEPDRQKFVLQLIDSSTLKIEHQNGACSKSESFNKPFTYKR